MIRLEEKTRLENLEIKLITLQQETQVKEAQIKELKQETQVQEARIKELQIKMLHSKPQVPDTFFVKNPYRF